jgi:diguanylate cyclase (GGDEF)-like protein
MFSILVVESEGVITDSIKGHLANEVCQAVTVLNDEDAVQFALREMPSLIVLDVMRSAFDVYPVIRQLRDQPKCMHIPIILLSPHGSLVEKVRAYELGVDSYIAKPFSIDELLVHVRCHLRRIQQTTLSPLTQLPGGLQLERAIHYKLHGSDPWSVLYLDLDNFKPFNDAYGFLAGNDMISLVGHICQRVVCVHGNADDFVGHIGGDDFVIVTTPEREKALCRHILARYKEESVALYRREDLERGAIQGIDREGQPFEFPLVSLSIGVVSDRFHGIHTIGDIGMLTAEAKRRAKQSSNNVSHISLGWQHQLGDHFLGSHATYPLDLIAPFRQCLFRFAEGDAYC